jgi:hypothetical protein
VIRPGRYWVTDLDGTEREVIGVRAAVDASEAGSSVDAAGLIGRLAFDRETHRRQVEGEG